MSVYLILSHHNNILSCRVLHKNIVCTFCGPGFNISYPYFPIQHIFTSMYTNGRSDRNPLSPFGTVHPFPHELSRWPPLQG